MGIGSYSAVQDVEQFTRRIRFTADGVVLSAEDQYNLTFCFRAAYCLLVDLLPTGDPGLHAFGCFLTGSETLDVLRVAKSLKAYSDLVVDKVVAWRGEGPILTMQDFKRLARSSNLYWGLATPMSSAVAENAKNPSVEGFRTVFQWFEFLRHVNVKSLDLGVENEKSYIDFEKEIQTWSYSDEDCVILSDILSEWCCDFSTEEFWPRHGPGAVAREKGRLGGAWKTSLLASDLRLEYFLSRLTPDFPYYAATPSSVLDRTNEIVFVPKKMDKNRVISKEPATLAYFQQGVSTCIQQTIFDSVPLKGHVALANQNKSQDFAWEGSVTGGYATLDLSNASDSVSLALIKSCVKNDRLRRALICTRSDRARLPSGRTIPLAKFAPMGSATCFPMETLIFAAVCERAVREISGRASHDDDYVVYGDDIVIRTVFVQRTLELLRMYHFTVNVSKSFFGQNTLRFREACGGYFLNGNDVTPIRLSRRIALMEPSGRRGQIGPRVSLIALCNECLQRGFLSVRKCALAQLKAYYPGLRGIPFSRLEDEEVPFALQTFSDCCTNYNLRRKTPPHSREWWGSDVIEIYDVKASVDASVKPHSSVPACTLDEARWYHYWLREAKNRHHVALGGRDLYAPEFGVSFAPEVIENRPQRTSDVRKWRASSF